MEFQSFINNPITLTVLILAIAVSLHNISGIIVAGIVQRVMRPRGSETKADNNKRKNTLSNIYSAIARLAVWLVAVSTILDVLHFNLASIATGAGFVGIIIGLGAQATIRDYLAGISILIENQYRVGDIVTLSGGTIGTGTSGVVEAISLRITKLRDLDGTLSIIRNGEASVITNRTYKYSSVVLDVSVPYDSDIDTVERVMNAVGRGMQKDEVLGKKISEPITFFRVDQFAASSLIIKAVGKVKPAAQWEIAGEYRRRLLKAFAVEGIKIALPQVIVHQKSDE